MYSPSTQYLKVLSDRLSVLNIPVYFELPKSSVLEPFIVIGTNSSDTSKTPQTGVLIEDMTTQIDIFLEGNSRTKAEEVKAKALRALGRAPMSSQVIKDDSIGRVVYHIIIRIKEIVY